ncbi:MAG TPA: complex I NDUFA9 subunit family protein [Gammaproteobacteria bacterium]|nr:complex I NDUFA9 subunit family protein [Gammaproteobacteria bacterium]
MTIEKVCVLGGTGFVGTQIVALLANRGYQIRVPSRNIERHRYLKVLPSIELLECDVKDSRALTAAITGCDAVINLIGILNQSGKASFRKVHTELPKQIAEICKEQGVSRLLHMSALHANKRGSSQYLQSKGRGEDQVHAIAGSCATSFRPSVIFGEGDSFLNRFAGLIRMAPGVLPLACAEARFAPVYVGDVAKAFVDALENPELAGKRVDLCGPRIYTLRELVEYTARLTGQSIRIWALPDWLARIEATFMEYLPGKPFTLDNFNSLQTDSVCSRATSLCPTSLEAIAPRYLGELDQEGLNQAYRRGARRAG